ncbi:pentapeptide repeat-containing protein [Longispora urticae]
MTLAPHHDPSPKTLTAQEHAAVRSLKQMALWKAVGFAVGAGVMATAGLAVCAWAIAGFPTVKNEDIATATLVELLKLSLAVVAGIGAIAALVVAYRRQRVAEAANQLAEVAEVRAHAAERRAEQIAAFNQNHAERTAADTRHDAAERRITELYIKSAEQLGSLKAPVRLAGLYALERLGRDNPELRQTVADVLCAYLRMPYTPPGGNHTPTNSTAPTTVDVAAEREAREELQVRLTAQTILTTHLHDPRSPGERNDTAPDPGHYPAYWTIDVNLTGATLADFDLNDCRLHKAQFARTTFTGDAGFSGAVFTGAAGFEEARFTGDAWFEDAKFTEAAEFEGTTFIEDAWFEGATFDSSAWFGNATFISKAAFRKATFALSAWFVEATFGGSAEFGSSAFTRDASFGKATFNMRAEFKEATFAETASFDETTFDGLADFGGATFTGDARFEPGAFAWNEGAEAAAFFQEVGFNEAQALETASNQRPRAWPAGWTTGPAANGWCPLVRSSLQLADLAGSTDPASTG